MGPTVMFGAPSLTSHQGRPMEPLALRGRPVELLALRSRPVEPLPPSRVDLRGTFPFAVDLWRSYLSLESTYGGLSPSGSTLEALPPSGIDLWKEMFWRTSTPAIIPPTPHSYWEQIHITNAHERSQDLAISLSHSWLPRSSIQDVFNVEIPLINSSLQKRRYNEKKSKVFKNMMILHM